MVLLSTWGRNVSNILHAMEIYILISMPVVDCGEMHYFILQCQCPIPTLSTVVLPVVYCTSVQA